LFLIVLLNIIDCGLVMGELILDIYFIKGLCICFVIVLFDTVKPVWRGHILDKEKVAL